MEFGRRLRLTYLYDHFTSKAGHTNSLYSLLASKRNGQCKLRSDGMDYVIFGGRSGERDLQAALRASSRAFIAHAIFM